MNKQHPIFEITPNTRIFSQSDIQVEPQGMIPKFWVEHPQLGRSLVKLDKPFGKNWTEKVAYEIGKLMQLPVVRYELAVLSNDFENAGATGIVTPNYKQDGFTYEAAEDMMLRDLGRFPYRFEEELEFVTRNNLALPPNYRPLDGIETGSDLWAGMIVFDGLIGNRDRHGKNWEVGFDSQGNKSLAPIFDSGMSFGMTLGNRLGTEADLTPKKYMKTQASYFGQYHIELLDKLIQTNPQATQVWLQKINSISLNNLAEIFDAIPDSHITSVEKEFARELVKFNRQSFLELGIESGLEILNPYQKLATKIENSFITDINNALAPDFRAELKGNRIAIELELDGDFVSMIEIVKETKNEWRLVTDRFDSEEVITELNLKIAGITPQQEKSIRQENDLDIGLEP